MKNSGVETSEGDPELIFVKVTPPQNAFLFYDQNKNNIRRQSKVGGGGVVIAEIPRER